MTDLATMTNTAIVKAYAVNSKRQSKINNKLIEDGHGSVRFSDMRQDPSLHPLIPKYLELVDAAQDLRVEADMRYGPGLIDMDSLVIAQGGRYRRR